MGKFAVSLWGGLLALGLLLANPARTSAAQVDADLEWVETEVALSSDGKAMVQYKVHWRVHNGSMGGFYFQGERGKINWHLPGLGAMVDGNKRYQLTVKNLGNRWDILLADRQRFGPGDITFVLTYCPHDGYKTLAFRRIL